jgi:hypothetical protein
VQENIAAQHPKRAPNRKMFPQKQKMAKNAKEKTF